MPPPAALRACVEHQWKGNVRELRSAVEQALLLAPGAEIDVGDLLPDAGAENPAVGAAQEMLRGRIAKVLKPLSYREREIIKLRYGLGDGYSYTLEEVGLQFSATRERIRQIEAKALRKLKHPSRSRILRSFLDD